MFKKFLFILFSFLICLDCLRADVAVLGKSDESKVLDILPASHSRVARWHIRSSYYDVDGNGVLDFIRHEAEYDGRKSAAEALLKKSSIQVYKGSYFNDKKYFELDYFPMLTIGNVCVHPSKTIAHDFNRDGVVDFLTACSGFDSPPFPGEKSIISMSGPYGYKNIEIGPVGYYHAAALVDLNGDGVLDIVLADMWTGLNFFLNNGDGSFTQDFKKRTSFLVNHKNMVSLEVYDFNGDGYLDLVAGSNDEKVNPSVIMLNDGLGDFSKTIKIPINANYSTVYDTLKIGDQLYILRWRASGNMRNIEILDVKSMKIRDTGIHVENRGENDLPFPVQLFYIGGKLSVDDLGDIGMNQALEEYYRRLQ
jgi:FG-GAP-like repeat